MEEKKPESQSVSTAHRVLTVVGIILCVILVPILILNCILLIKGFANPDEVPSFGGFFPLIVLTESMEPDIMGGDLIFCREIAPEDVKIGDYISFFDPRGGSSITTHEVIGFETDPVTGEQMFVTKGTNNNAVDTEPVPYQNLVGIYLDLRIPFAGRIALFMQTPAGLIVCVLVPVLLLVGYDILRRRKYEKQHSDDKDELMRELEELRALAAKRHGANEGDGAANNGE